MLLELIFAPLFLFINFLIGLIPNFQTFNSDVPQTFMDYVGYGLYFFGTTPFILVITCVLFWCGIELAWSIIEWIYRKIPGVS